MQDQSSVTSNAPGMGQPQQSGRTAPDEVPDVTQGQSSVMSDAPCVGQFLQVENADFDVTPDVAPVSEGQHRLPLAMSVALALPLWRLVNQARPLRSLPSWGGSWGDVHGHQPSTGG